MLQITEELVEKLRNKDEEAFQKIYNAYVKLIYHIAYSYTYNKEDAEDIVSEVFRRLCIPFILIKKMANSKNGLV